MARDAMGQYLLGTCYEDGKGIEKDLNLAVKLYQSAADAGIIEAQVALAMLYLVGKGVRKNIKKAKELLTKASEAGNEFAKETLNTLFNNNI